MGSLKYAILCARPNIYFVARVINRFQSNLGLEHFVTVKHILKYIQITKDYMFLYLGRNFTPIGI